VAMPPGAVSEPRDCVTITEPTDAPNPTPAAAPHASAGHRRALVRRDARPEAPDVWRIMSTACAASLNDG
jgi:hypothetical protein